MGPERSYQDKVLAEYAKAYPSAPLPERVIEAFYAIPRHRFVQRYRNRLDGEWVQVTPENLDQRLPALYQDQNLVLEGQETEFQRTGEPPRPLSTITKPTWVLRMLEMLRLERGHKVYELGSGSGWSTALMGHIVGPQGMVVSYEILPDQARRAQGNLASFPMSQVQLRSGDGASGDPTVAPFDRAVFTAGAYDIPPAFFGQVREGGLLLFVLRNKGEMDHFVLFEKKNGHFDSLFLLPCKFVPMTGDLQDEGLGAESLPEVFTKYGIPDQPAESMASSFPKLPPNAFYIMTHSLRSFLSIRDPFFELLVDKDGNPVFGLLDKANRSLVVVGPGGIASYGPSPMALRLNLLMTLWKSQGQPALERFRVSAFPSSAHVEAGPGQWLVRRKRSQFLWSLPQPA